MRFLSILFAPLLALVPEPAFAKDAAATPLRDGAKAKAGEIARQSSGILRRGASASARVIRAARVRMRGEGQQVDAPRRFQVNLALDGRRLIEFE